MREAVGLAVAVATTVASRSLNRFQHLRMSSQNKTLPHLRYDCLDTAAHAQVHLNWLPITDGSPHYFKNPGPCSTESCFRFHFEEENLEWES